MILTLRKNVVTLFVDRSGQQWIVLDAEGNFWIVPSDHENPWDQRQPYYPTDQTELERVTDRAPATIVFQIEKDVVIIRATAIESITLGLPEPVGKEVALPNIPKAKRLK